MLYLADLVVLYLAEQWWLEGLALDPNINLYNVP